MKTIKQCALPVTTTITYIMYPSVWVATLLLKLRLAHGCFSACFEKFERTSFLQITGKEVLQKISPQGNFEEVVFWNSILLLILGEKDVYCCVLISLIYSNIKEPQKYKKHKMISRWTFYKHFDKYPLQIGIFF